MSADRIEHDEEIGRMFAVYPDESRTGTVRFPYEVGILARGKLADTVAYGRSLGLEVQVHVGGGFLVQRGFIVATGKGSALYRLLQRIAVVFEWENNN